MILLLHIKRAYPKKKRKYNRLSSSVQRISQKITKYLIVLLNWIGPGYTRNRMGCGCSSSALFAWYSSPGGNSGINSKLQTLFSIFCLMTIFTQLNLLKWLPSPIIQQMLWTTTVIIFKFKELKITKGSDPMPASASKISMACLMGMKRMMISCGC